MPYRMVMKEIRVSDFMLPLSEGESDTLPEAERERALRSDEILETALRKFDTGMAHHFMENARLARHSREQLTRGRALASAEGD